MEQALYACRFVQFAATMLLFGSSAFRFYALRGDISIAEFDDWFRPVALVLSILTLLSALALLLFQSAAMAGAPVAALDPATVSAVLFETRFGQVWRWHLLFSVILVFACPVRSRKRQSFILILSLLTLATLAWTGHAAMAEGAARIIHGLNQSAHLLAAGLWLGGLAPLAWLLLWARAAQDDAGVRRTRDAVDYFSQMGYAAVTVIALTGSVNTLLLVGNFGALLGTPYGRLLTVKLVLFLAMVVVALWNRIRLAPWIDHDPLVLAALRRNVRLEQFLGLCILAIVSILGTWPPASTGGP